MTILQLSLTILCLVSNAAVFALTISTIIAWELKDMD